MLRQILTTAFLSGILAGIFISGLQALLTTPLILEAEKYETAQADPGTDHFGGGMIRTAAADGAVFQTAGFNMTSSDRGGVQKAAFQLAHSDSHDGHGGADSSGEGAGAAPWAPQDGFERFISTLGANIVISVAYALLLTAAFALHGQPLNTVRGLLWGLGAAASFTLAPALGMAPELPTSMAAEIGGRQIWWGLTVAASAAGLWCIFLTEKFAIRAGGVLLLVLPHLVGAPHPVDVGGPVPPEIAAHFAATSIAVNVIFWAFLGAVAGTVYQHFATDDEVSTVSKSSA